LHPLDTPRCTRAGGYDVILVSDAHTANDQTAWGRRRHSRSSRTRTSTGRIRRRRGGRPAWSRPSVSTSPALHDARCWSNPELLTLNRKKARRNGLFCSEWVVDGCLQCWRCSSVLQGACLQLGRFGDSVATGGSGDRHGRTHLARQVVNQRAEGVCRVAELRAP
jgi:hypothetical protein